MPYFRPNIERLEGYQPGKQPAAADFIKLNTNENPYPPAPAVQEAIRREIGEALRRYPNPMADPLREAAATAYGVPVESILAGNGSDDLLTMILRSFVDPGDRVAFPYPTYTLYETLTRIQDGEPAAIDFNPDYSLPSGLAAARAKVTFVSNPNSPSGTMAPKEELDALAKELEGILVIDEAYADFAEFHCLDLALKHPNVIVLRSFSKSFSLAGMRLGLAFAAPQLIEGLTKVKDSYNVNRLSIAAGAAALAHIDEMRRNASRIKATRARLTEELTKLGFYVFPSQANFVLARAGDAAQARRLQQQLEARRILVRYFDLPRVDDCLRITVGTDAEIDALLAALRELLSAPT